MEYQTLTPEQLLGPLNKGILIVGFIPFQSIGSRGIKNKKDTRGGSRPLPHLVFAIAKAN